MGTQEECFSSGKCVPLHTFSFHPHFCPFLGAADDFF